MMKTEQTAIDLYRQTFGGEPDFIVKAPGRVNLIGEHTDYNEGYVFPMALDKGVCLAITLNQTNKLNIIAENFNTTIETIDLTQLQKAATNWQEYIKGVAQQVRTAYQIELNGFNVAITSDLPIGAGLSSSAALELAFARAFTLCNGIEWEPVKMAQLCQQAENNWVGVNCGIMDQLISACGKKDHALLIDCRDLSYENIPWLKGVSLVIMDTATRRGLKDSAYNERRQQCEQAVQILGVAALRDVSLQQLEAAKTSLPELVYKRAKHVVTECERTLKAKVALINNDSELLGQLFTQSHQSLLDDFAVTNFALDEIVAIAHQHPACFGARMTGAGFGGCAIALVAQQQANEFCRFLRNRYKLKTGLESKLYIANASAGAQVEELHAVSACYN